MKNRIYFAQQGILLCHLVNVNMHVLENCQCMSLEEIPATLLCIKIVLKLLYGDPVSATIK